RTRGGARSAEAIEAADNAAATPADAEAGSSEGRTRSRRRTRSGNAPEATGPAVEKEAGENAERPARRRRRRRPAATSDTPASAD
ncbi:ATP-dependent helicase, partial [Amycolatopsis mediterranei]